MTLTAHLWQSTLCTAAAAIVVLMLRRAPARYRHAGWMLAAAKFLAPFAFLFATGAAFSTWLAPAELPLARWIDRSLPFFTLRSGTSDLWTLSRRVDLIWLALIVVWMVGAAALVTWRVRQWRATVLLVQHSTRLNSGREADALARTADGPVLRSGDDRHAVDARRARRDVNGTATRGLFDEAGGRQGSKACERNQAGLHT
jgi:hypothetical protein